ncbi:hypothetical protein [Allorhizobium taibaishanense]|nr:hypothetical protein [Allorhizobium taibaishanense]MBB4005799.1 hypothetical protein [Allorhizobium taibaishanense]
MTDSNGNDLSGHYTSRPTDTYGIASAVRSAITEWIAAGKPVGTWKMSS